MDDEDKRSVDALIAGMGELEDVLIESMPVGQMARLLLGYFASVEMFAVKGEDGLGMVPQPVLDYHNTAKDIISALP